MRTPNINTVTRLHLVEGNLSVWNYHLSITGKSGAPSLCGTTAVMRSGVPLASWNTEPGHLRMKYCKQCTKLAKEHGFHVNEANEKTLVFDAVPGSSL